MDMAKVFFYLWEALALQFVPFLKLTGNLKDKELTLTHLHLFFLLFLQIWTKEQPSG